MSELGEYLERLAEGQVPAEAPPDCEVREELARLAAYLGELTHFTRAMASGDLSATMHLRGPLAGSLKGLHANLRHLTWQTQEVAAGDLSQRVDFLGDFSVAFNHMVKALEQARNDLTAKNAELAMALQDLRATQSQLLQQEKMASVGQLAAGVAHEINNPMGFIISNLGTLKSYGETLTEYLRDLDLMATKYPEAERAHLAELRQMMDIDFLLEDMPTLIKESLDGAQRVKTIVQSLRSFSAVDQQGAQTINVNDLLDSTVDVAWNELKAKADVARSYGTVPAVEGHAQELGQAILNILRNAAQAIAERGIIHLKTGVEDGMVVIAITDNGCGIPPEIIGRVFDPFFTTRPPGQGTGLGLSTCYDTVKKHGGTIEATSVPGKRTTFTIRLPAAAG